MGNELKIGDILIDNDPREQGRRTVRVVDVLPYGIRGVSGPKNTRVTIRRDRIHTDGKPRKSGFSLKVES